MAIRKARALAQSSVELRKEMGMPFPQFNLSASIQDNPQDVADKIRKLLLLENIREIEDVRLALEIYIERFESLGIAVFQLSLTQDNVRGFAIVDDLIPIIGIKRGGEQAHSKIFTLFHELGHVLLNEDAISDLSLHPQWELEIWCNAFSGEVLIPSKELLSMEIVHDYQRKGQKEWKLKDLVELGNHFHVGPLAILRSLFEKQLTTKAFYNEKHNQWNRPQFGRAKNPEGKKFSQGGSSGKRKNLYCFSFQSI